VERSLSDHASVEISTNGTDWTVIWTNDASVSIMDDSWQSVSYKLGPLADRNSNVRVRWGIGPTDGSWNFTGWNLDDVELFGAPKSGEGNHFAVSAAGHAPSFTLTWPSQANLTYSVEYTKTVSAPFKTLATHILATPPFNTYKPLISDQQNPASFYRIRIE
jgi:hypothetical protein